MKIKFEFDTGEEGFYDSFDHIKLYQMQIASDMAMALNEMKDAIRSQIKYTDKTEINLETLQDKFFEIIDNHDISFEKLGY